jgi:anti-sigma factor RsiW
MSCSSYDWKAYALGEIDPGDRHQAEAHAATCPSCREELATLRLTLDAMSTLREEEIPRRIAFVSDKVFEPRWWNGFMRPSFAAAAVIAAAILVHGWMMRPVSSIDAAAPSIDTAAIQSRIDAAVTKAVAEIQQRQAQETAKVLAVAEQHFAEQRQADLATAGYNLDLLRKELNTMYALNTGAGIR